MSKKKLTINIEEAFLKEQAASGDGNTANKSDQNVSFRPFFLGFLLIILISAIAWPFIPRRYEASASIILRTVPSNADMTKHTGYLRQSLEENALQSEIDKISAPALLQIIIDRHNLANDPEFSSPGLISSTLGDRPQDTRASTQKLRQKGKVSFKSIAQPAILYRQFWFQIKGSGQSRRDDRNVAQCICQRSNPAKKEDF